MSHGENEPDTPSATGKPFDTQHHRPGSSTRRDDLPRSRRLLDHGPRAARLRPAATSRDGDDDEFIDHQFGPADLNHDGRDHDHLDGRSVDHRRSVDHGTDRPRSVHDRDADPV